MLHNMQSISNMDKMSKSELTSTIEKQNDQLRRYESRLRDVVTAYKGLMCEKKALESSLSAIHQAEDASNPGVDSITTLTQSMSTLAAEKARMEEAFQNDKKLVKEQSEKVINDLQDQLQSISKQRQSELDNLKAKLAFEIQEREREHTKHVLMLKELQMKLNSERRSKEKLEDKFVISNDPGSRELEKRFRDLNSELEATQRKLNRAEARTIETPQMLVQLQEEIAQMKQNHHIALREEHIKAKRAEETANKMRASQEERVAALEARLAELSDTVGEYDRQRRRDQDVIQHLRDNLNIKNDEERHSGTFDSQLSVADDDKIDTISNTQESSSMKDLQQIIDKIHTLKKELLITNENMGSPIEIWSIFNMNGSNVQNLHSVCKAELAAVKTECDIYKKQLLQSNMLKMDMDTRDKGANGNDENEQLKYHIKTLQDKVEVLNQQMDETEKECDAKISVLEEKIKIEKAVHKDELSERINRIQSLEHQLQTQRDRYAILLSERESEIKARQERGIDSKMDKNGKFDLNGSLHEVSAPPHMLHYAHELARKDLEISSLRKEKHLLEGHLRDCQRETTIDKDRFKEVRRNLKEEIDRLRRIQTREGANLEYLKNVVFSYLLSTDSYSKRHMLNAIAAVLHFTDSEKECAYRVVS